MSILVRVKVPQAATIILIYPQGCQARRQHTLISRQARETLLACGARVNQAKVKWSLSADLSH
jgi:hypothetical protein